MTGLSELPGPSGPSGAIHDIGYQRYQGRRLGRWHGARTLFIHSLRTGYGLGRSAKAKIFPWLVVAILAVIVAVPIAIRTQLGEPVMSYLDFADVAFSFVILYAAIVAPELVSRDLRNAVLPLYFSRPLGRTDYATAKLAALMAAAGLLLMAPMLLMFSGAMLTVDGWSAVGSELGDLGAGLAYAAVQVLVICGIALLIASLVGRRAVAAGVIVGTFLVTTPVVAVLDAGPETTQQLSGLASPTFLVAGVRQWWFGDTGLAIGPYGPVYGAVALALVVSCVALVMLRYRKVRA